MPWKNKRDELNRQFFKQIEVQKEYFDALDITEEWQIYSVDSSGRKDPKLSPYVVREVLKDAARELGKDEILSRLEGNVNIAQVYDFETVFRAKEILAKESVKHDEYHIYKSPRTGRNNKYFLGLKQAQEYLEMRKLETMRRNKKPRRIEDLRV